MKILKQGFAIAAVLTLALGIAANTAVFSVANAVLFCALPYKNPAQLVVALFGGENPASPADYYDWKTQNTVFDEVSAAEYWTPNLTGRDRPEQMWGLRVSDNLFEMLGVPAAIGRTFTSVEEQPGGAPLVVLSDRLWKRRFAANPDVVGQVLKLDGHDYQVLGVMPADFGFPLFWATRAEFWAPLPLANRRTSGARSLRVFARLKATATLDRARAEMEVITSRIADRRPSTRSEPALRILPLQEKIVGDVRPALLALMTAAGLVLLIACANIANLLLARGNGRRREMAVRIALGASRGRLIRQLLRENAILTCSGSAAGLALAWWALRVLLSRLPIELLPRQAAIGIDMTVLGFLLVLSIAVTFLFGALPALQASRADVNAALKDAARSTGGQQTHWRRRLLAGAEIALAVVLLIGAGLMVRSFARLHGVDPGFATEQVLTMTVSVAGTNQSPAEKRAGFYLAVVDRAAALPDVEAASLINHLPLAGDVWAVPFVAEGQVPAKPEDQPSAVYRVVYPGYFQTLRILLAGRDFNDLDQGGAPAVAVVNEALARRYFPGGKAIGKRIRLGGADAAGPWIAIVGVVPAVKQKGWTDQTGSEIYLPLLQSAAFLADTGSPFSYMTLVVRGRGDVANLTSAIRNQIWSLEPNAPISSVATMEEIVGQQLARPRAAMLLGVTFALVGWTLAIVGVYSVMAYSVSQRTREIGLRGALGARPGDILRLVLKEGALVSAAGIAAGLAGALALGRLLQGLLFEVRPDDPATFVLVPLGIALVSLVACYVPARRALGVDPVTALRE